MTAHRQLRGVAAIEFAILLIPLVIMTFGMTELGRAFYVYNELVKTTRDASRYLSMQSSGVGETEARCLVLYGKTVCTGTPLIPDLTTEMIDIDYESAVDTGQGSVDLVRVTIDGYPFTSIVPWVIQDFIFGPISCTMRQGGS